MADVKISALPASTTPLVGTEILPIVQSGITKKVTVVDLTANRSVSGTSFVPTGSAVPNNGMFLGAANSVSIATNSTEHWMVNASGNLNPVGSKGIGTALAAVNGVYTTDATLTTGNLVIGTSGKGIDFSADGQAAGMTSELLDDYEEGTFTPTLLSGGAAVDRTYSVNVGSYTKIGNRVNFEIYILLSAKGSSVGNLQIFGLPFTSGFGSDAVTAAAISNTTYTGQITPYIAGNNTVINLYSSSSGSGLTFLTDTNLTDTSFFLLSGQYKV